MPRVKSQKANKDYPAAGIKKGQTYYSWKFRYGGKHMSLTYPKPSQLTQSAYLSELYDIQEAASNIADVSEIPDIYTRLEELRDTCQESLDNMPEALQESSVLNERIEALDNTLSELDDVKDRAENYEALKDEEDGGTDVYDLIMSDFWDVDICGE